MKWFRNASITNKLAVINVVATLVALLMSGAAVFIYEITTFQPRLLQQVDIDVEALSSNLTAPLRFNDRQRAREALNILRQRPEVELAIVTTPIGDEFARYQAKGVKRGQPLPIDGNVQDRFGYVFRENYLDYTYQIFDHEDWLGNIYIRYRLPPLYARLPQYGLMVTVVILALLMMGALVQRGLRLYLAGPIRTLTRNISEVAGRYGGSVVSTGQQDEVRYLSSAFQRMLHQVGRHQQALQRANLELQERSQELERELEERRQAEKQLTYMARHDVLTSLPNRSAFDLRLEELLEDAQGEGHFHALLYMDLDQFKVVNDTCGHVAGDHLLRQASELLRQDIRQGDILARLGGDEFGVLLPYCNIDVAIRIANKLRQTIQDFRFSWDDKTFAIGVSIGLVPIGPESESRDSLLSIADALCYTAKDNGRNCVEIYQGEQNGTVNRQAEMHWVSRITEAMEEQRIVLMYQAIQPMDEHIEGLHYEILIRLQDVSGELIAPGAFLPAAERYNLMPRLDRYVVQSTFSWLNRNPQHMQCLGLCSINLSGGSLGDDDFHEFIVAQLKKFQIPPEKICFEITETMAVQALTKTVAFMEHFKAMGCKFSLDDFGSGFSSYAYLKNLPVDFLKIDGAFVRDIVDDPLDMAMVKSINEIGHVMGKRTIAEYVENAAILSLLKTIGVDYAQGYVIGRPEPLDNILFTHRREISAN